MKSKMSLVIVILLAMSLFIVACGSAEPTPPPATPTPEVHPGEALVSGRCGTCHSLGVIQNAKYDAAGWKTTVDRMVNVGATLNDEQKVQVVDYLAKTYGK